VASGPTGVPNLHFNPNGASAWDGDGSYGDWYGAHELGHAWGRGHTLCAGDEGMPVYYPYTGGRISPALAGDTALFGFDIGTRDIYPPTWKDVMSYCPNEWVSDHTYEGLMSGFAAPAPSDSMVDRRTLAQTDRLLVIGAIDPATNQVVLQPLYIVPNASDVEPRLPGPYAIVLRSAAAAELGRYPFTPEDMTAGPDPRTGATQNDVHVLAISELVPYVVGTTRVDIEGPGGVLLKTVSAGASDPTVRLTTPNGGEILAGDVITVAWTASDPDGDLLTFNVQYSPDNGASWTMVAQNLSEHNIALDAVNIPSGAAARFRVWVSDGIHTASDESDAPFTVPNRVPSAEITQPAGTVAVAISQTLGLDGRAYDVDTGSMTSSQLQWLSSLDGLLGNGAQLSVAGLREGFHTITFRADDGFGGVATDTVDVIVVSDPSQLPPRPDALVAGPDPILFDTRMGVTRVRLSIDNQNIANPVVWTAVASASWLGLGVTSGTTPDQMYVTLNEAGLPRGYYTATISLTSPALPGQSTTVGVAASISGQRLYLPVQLMQGP